MFKRLLAVITALCLFTGCASANTVTISPLTDENGNAIKDAAGAQANGWDAPLITKPLEDGSVAVYGVESEPLPALWAAYESAFRTELAAMYEGLAAQDVPLFGPVFSDGAYVYMMSLNSAVVLIRTQGTDGAAQVNEIKIEGMKDEGNDESVKNDVRSLAAAAYRATGFLSVPGKSITTILELDSDPVSFESERAYWTENGWTLGFSSGAFTWNADISFAEPAAVVAPVQLFKTPAESYPFISRDGMTVRLLIKKLTRFAQMFGMKAPVFSGAAVSQADGTALLTGTLNKHGTIEIRADGMDETSRVLGVLITQTDGDSVAAWGAALNAFLSLSVPDESMMQVLTGLSGTNGAWGELCAMYPYAAYHGVALQTYEADGVLTAVLYGADAN